MPDRTLFYMPVQGLPGDVYQISGSEYDHIVKALRKSVDDPLEVVDGTGRILHSTIIDIQKDSVTCSIDDVELPDNELPVHVTLAVALIKNQRYEWMVEKATEMGVAEIQPLNTDRVVRSGFRGDRLRKKAIAAMKQSERAVLPAIRGPVELAEYLETLSADSAFYARQNQSFPMLSNYQDNSTFHHITVLIGPEGGWSDKELDNFESHEFRPLSLGARRLRTETAAVTAMSQIALLWDSDHSRQQEAV
ncbi:MAG: 16S rRNA (uracil(1498)-N(3))-methyltransferase [Candidatus Marinimicrobia bacterium]|nr:16S rRNA (uracil(1498)-N(3))-methyltransferase [Candidatus Neomarinimicrobiota bacterium]MCF7880266.1 16S rRNA (uracil(1498)-N(3))-methyltransferase [Candidatus Neomarinimicrobiota bacterium]